VIRSGTLQTHNLQQRFGFQGVFGEELLPLADEVDPTEHRLQHHPRLAGRSHRALSFV